MWIPIYDPIEPHIIDDSNGECVATCFHYQRNDEPLTHAWSRACVMSLAPDLHRMLSDIVEHAERVLPEELYPQLKAARQLLSKVGVLYEERRTTGSGEISDGGIGVF